ncbi:ribosome biogenesis GTP-binding protein YihA/YsxC [Asticcacaulis sp. EMRT-3]|uniref:ribosome biogenesis GTP-binding protein YihA/YsxC n=1 Tax=Asticcacaulis sp. EMRT-3 TaxID=3040349 RepID=UPI0024AF556A|nr:ribosome biogenesis GTP-binding protein YihA/YsxC [Asticcacaulis sp. EMRT-3]MDI7773863.1 ribosome biogenesis GTP-binding protein YihA/YsxC [Asticcacaulis sp. EMRT-3]
MTAPLYSEETLETARVLFARPVSFVMGAAAVAQLPPDDLPEVAFAGRSNVGKSSLINALVNQKHLARASNEPGRTRELNFFLLNDALHMVDLPGYGWAKASKVTVKKFQNLGRDYLRGRSGLKRAYLLIDARHGLKTVDTEPMDALDKAAVSYQIVLTKADKIKPAELAQVIEATQGAIKKRPAAHPVVLATSAETGLGIPELRAEIMTACAVEL